MNLKRFFKVYSDNFKAEVSSISTYRTSFILNITSLIIDALIPVLIAFIIYQFTPGFSGWSLPEILVFMGCVNITLGLAHAFVLGFSWVTSELIIKGDFDTILLKPVNPLGYMIGKVIDIDGFAQILSGVFIVCLGLFNLNQFPSLIDFFYFIAFIINGFLLWFSLSLFTGALCFKYPQASEFNQLLFNLTDFANYPLNIYGNVLTFVFTFVFPIGVISFYPAQALLGRLLDMPLLLIISFITILIFSLSILFYYKSLRNYSSAGG